MRSIQDFLVSLPKAFNDEMKLGDSKIYIDPKYNEFQHRKMEAEILAVPEKYKTNAKVGDTLYFHHHVVIAGNGNGQKIEDGVYVVRFDPDNSHYTQAYAFKCKDTGNIELLSEWIFLNPEEQEKEEVTDSGIVMSTEKPSYNQYGYVLYDSPQTKEIGLKSGDKVMIVKNADYEMNINDQKVYRVHLDQIYAVLL